MIKCIVVSTLLILFAGACWGLCPFAAFAVPFAIIATPKLIMELIVFLLGR